MGNKLEQLLNSLIEKGFRPFWRYDKLMWGWRFWSRQFVKFWIFPEEEFTLRELVSINSGLWQFVCENGMVEIEYWKIREKYNETSPTTDKNKIITYRQLLGEDNYEYRLIETALTDEDKLEQFLLDNIYIDE
jgi:hypothetical protein